MKFEPNEYHTDDDDESRSSQFTTENNTVVQLSTEYRRLASLDGGIHSGVPTRTTPTLTPTTLRNIEQTFFELTNEQPSTVPCQAGFVAPLPSFQFETQVQHQPPQQHHTLQPAFTQSFAITSHSNAHTIDPMHLAPAGATTVSNTSLALSNHDENSYDSFASQSSNESWLSPPPTLADDSLSGPNNSTTPPSSRRRNMGGRRPKNASNLTPAEEEKRKVRRERNKLAAARCRKRRVDQTNDLTDKVNILEKEKQKLQTELQDLQATKNDLEYILHEHQSDCRLLPSSNTGININAKQEFKQPPVSQQLNHIPPPLMLNKIKEEPQDSNSLDADGPPSPKRLHLSNLNNPIISSSAGCDTPTSLNTPNILPPSIRPNRPSTLAVPISMTPSQCKSITDMAGVSISTPSNGVMFNFDSLMEGGTGLTPVSQPLMPNYPTMHHRNPLDLATPTSEPSKLVSL